MIVLPGSRGPIAEPSATDHEILPLFRGAKSRDATGSWVSPTSE